MKKLLFFLPLILYAQVIDTVIYLSDEPFELLYIPDGNELYINFRRSSGYFLVLDCSTYSIKKTITRPAGYGGSAYGVWNERRNKIYYSFSPRPESIAVIDNRTDSIIKWINYDTYWPLCYNSKDDKIYATNGSSVAVIDCETDSIIKIITQPYNLSHFILWDSIGNKVYCGSGWARDEVTVINCANDSVIKVIHTRLSTPCAGVYNPQRRKVYVAGYWGRGGVVIDGVGDTLIKYLPIWFNQEDVGLILNSLEDKVYWYAEDTLDDFLLGIDCRLDSVISRVRCGYLASMCLTSWSNRLYFAGTSLSVLDCRNDSIIARINLGSLSVSMTCNPQNHRIYLSGIYDSALYVIRDEIPGIEESRSPLGVCPIRANQQPIEIYPNPAKTVICVRWGMDFSPVSKIPDSGTPFEQSAFGGLKIFDVSGKLIKEVALTDTDQEIKIPLKGINPGIYFLQLGKETKKFLIVK